MPPYATEAICLKTYDYSESSKIVNLYSPTHGLIRAIAKGTKRGKSPLMGACERLTVNQYQLFEGKTLHTLCQYQAVDTFSHLRGHLLKLAMATHMADLIHTMATEQDTESEAIYQALKTGLVALNELTSPNAADPLQRALEDLLKADGVTETLLICRIVVCFQVTLLHLTGYFPDLNTCVVTHQPIDFQQPYYRFSADMGGLVLTETAPKESPVHRQWVPVSTSTLQVLLQPENLTRWQNANPMKVLRFLNYYFTSLPVTNQKTQPFKSFAFVERLLGWEEPTVHELASA